MPNILSKKKILNAALVLLMASFLLEKFVSFPYSKKIIEYLQNLVIPFMTLIINISEGQGEPIINDGIQGNNHNNNENANDLANEGNNEAIPPEPANGQNQNQLNQLNKIYNN